MEIYPHYWSTIEGPPEQSQALSWKLKITTVSKRAAFKQSPFFTKHRNKPKHQGEPQQDNQ